MTNDERLYVPEDHAMSIQTWCAEFYQQQAHELADATDDRCVWKLIVYTQASGIS